VLVGACCPLPGGMACSVSARFCDRMRRTQRRYAVAARHSRLCGCRRVGWQCVAAASIWLLGVAAACRQACVCAVCGMESTGCCKPLHARRCGLKHMPLQGGLAAHAQRVVCCLSDASCAVRHVSWLVCRGRVAAHHRVTAGSASWQCAAPAALYTSAWRGECFHLFLALLGPRAPRGAARMQAARCGCRA
jgi:hypothetical protein